MKIEDYVNGQGSLIEGGGGGVGPGDRCVVPGSNGLTSTTALQTL